MKSRSTTHLKQSYCRVPLSTNRAAVIITIGVVIALIVLGILPFMMFKAEMEMKMYLGEDEGDNSLETKVLSSAIEYESCGSYYYYWCSHCIFVDGSLLH